MTRIVITIYNYFKSHPFTAWSIFIVVTALLTLSFLRLGYKEDISDFLPLDEKNSTALSVYQDISGANNLYAIVSLRDTSKIDQARIVECIDSFTYKLTPLEEKGLLKKVTKEIDMEAMMEVSDMVYENIPYFLTEADYARIDSLLSTKGYLQDHLEEDMQMLLFPTSDMLAQNISRDPYNLFTPVLGRLSRGGMQIDFDTYDSHILTPDSKRGIIILESGFGARESEQNGILVNKLDSAVNSTLSAMPDLEISLIGGPVIAVANADRIKTDSILAVVIAGILILALLIYVFRNARNIALIFVSVAWGWLFAMGCIALYYDAVSIIVIGIASVILGIAVNYPLHLIDHIRDCGNIRTTLKEIVGPLVIGNITTVGAFLCLVPLNAPALHDLGLFSSLLLIGTILFVLIFLPHAVKWRKNSKDSEPKLIMRIAGISPEKNKWVAYVILALTVVFAYFSLRTEFDSDMSNIIYMTDSQREDMTYFQSLVSTDTDTESVYVVGNGQTWEEALVNLEKSAGTVDSLTNAGIVKAQNHSADFLLSKQTQRERLHKWNEFKAKYEDRISEALSTDAVNIGFSEDAFSDFYEIIGSDYEPQDLDNFSLLANTIFMGSQSEDALIGRKSAVRALEVKQNDAEAVMDAINNTPAFEGISFDVRSMNDSIAGTLSDDFNYIGIACGFIVFVFLWLSLGNLELAIVSFLPMAVSWIWILGIMGMLGFKFNIVNIILATFIFGQGDDYTIFITEGLTYEYAYRRKVLASYKNSIIVSALIMFIGIGTLIFAKHPAMRSLGEVTVVGMLSVVLMAWLFPPLVFNWLVSSRGMQRKNPITLPKLLRTVWFDVTLWCTYIMLRLSAIGVSFKDENKAEALRFRISKALRNRLRRTPGVKVLKGVNLKGGDIACAYNQYGYIVANNGSSLSIILAMAFSYGTPVYCAEESATHIPGYLRKFAEKFGLLFYIENRKEIIGKGTANIFCAYGAEAVQPSDTHYIGRGIIRCSVYASDAANEGIAEVAEQPYMAHYSENVERRFFKEYVADRYLYKGADVARRARRNIKRALLGNVEGKVQGAYIKVDPEVNGAKPADEVELTVTLIDQGQGEASLLQALTEPQTRYRVWIDDSDSRALLRGCIEGFASNVEVLEEKP